MENIKVLIRIRPFLPNENEENTGLNIESNDAHKIEISRSLRKFEGYFDKVLTQTSTQKDVYNFVKPCISYIKKGINCTVLAYGQTGSGKTYTMFGGEWAINSQTNDYENRKNFSKDKYNFILNNELSINPFGKTNGIIPNLIMNLFQVYDKSKDNIKISCSYIQIYNEKVYDLLVNTDEIIQEKKRFNFSTNTKNKESIQPMIQKPLKIKNDKVNGVKIEGVNEIETETFFDIFELLREGETNRKIRQTSRNEMSSRSHTIFIINIKNLKTNIRSKIKLCDLAGSERYDSNESYKKIHFNEMCNINKSLLVLGNVIHSLANKKNSNFAPYKDSKLTQILEDSLGGKSITYLIATISPNGENFEESISTLKFADRAHEIMTQVTPNQVENEEFDPSKGGKEFTKIYNELTELKQLLNIRKKRGTLDPIQEELLKLKDENSQLKKCLGGGSNVMNLQKLVTENNNLKKEIKNLTQQNYSLRQEIQNSKTPTFFSSKSEKKYNKTNDNNTSEVLRDSGKNIVFGSIGKSHVVDYDLKKSLLANNNELDNIINDINNTENKTIEDPLDIYNDYNYQKKIINTEQSTTNQKNLKMQSYKTSKNNKYIEQDKTDNKINNKLDGVSNPYQRLQILNQLEEENRKRTQLLLDKIAKET